MTKRTDEEYAAAAEWAEQDMTLPRNSTTALRGDAAATFGRGLLERSAGRPSIDPAAAPGEQSPVRRFRLPAALDAELVDVAHAQHRKPSDVLRDALAEYLQTHAAG